MRWSLIVPLLVVTGGALNQPADPSKCDKHQHPFVVPAESIHARVGTIALRPTFTPLSLGEEIESRMQVFDTLVAVVLRSSGYQLIDTQVTDSLWNAAKDAVGPMFDAATGARDSTKWQAALDHFRSALRDEYAADGIMYPSVHRVKADFAGKTATWDGTKQATTSFGSTLADALGGHSYSGTTPALSLRVALLDTDGRVLYDNYGGIQVLSVPSHGQFHEVPDSLLLTDRERIVGAVQIALCQFLAAPAQH